MGTRAPRASAIAIAVGFALSAFLLSMFAWTQFGGPVPLKAQSYRFHALFGPEAAQLGPNSPVRISGVNVGTVIKVEQKPGSADVLMQLDAQYAPIPESTRAIVRFKTLLGESFVALTPGSPTGPKLPEGGDLPASQTAQVQTVDEVLGSFDAPTRRDLKQFLGDLSLALGGRGADLNTTIGSTGPAIDDLASVVDAIDQQRPAFQKLFRNGGTFLRTLNQRESDLQSLVTEGDRLFSATANRNRELTATVRALPSFLRNLRTTSKSIDGAIADAAPTLHTLRPVAPLIPGTIRDLSAASPDAEALFKGLRPVITAANRGLPAATRLVKGLKPLMDVLYPASRQLVPVVDLVDAYKKEVRAFGANVGAMTNGSVPGLNGKPHHYTRDMIPINPELFFGQPARQASNRHNVYLAPGGLANFPNLLSWSCSNVNNPQTLPLGDGPPCREQPPWTFRGKTRSYPHLEQDKP